MNTNVNPLSAEEMAKKHMRKITISRFINILALCIGVLLFCLLILGRISYTIFLVIYIDILVCIVVLRYIKQTWVASYDRILHIECDPYKYMELFKILKEKDTFKRGQVLFTICIAKGVYYCGNFDEAYNILKSIVFKKRTPFLLLQYYTMLLSCCDSLGYYDELEEIYAEVLKLKGTLKPKSALGKYAQLLEDATSAALAEPTQDYDTNYQLLSEQLSKSVTPLQIAVTNYRIVELSLRHEKYDDLKEKCEVIIAKGNKLFYVQKAESILENRQVNRNQF